MNTQLIGATSLLSTRLSYGCWRLVGTWNPKEVTPDRIVQGKRAVVAAYEAGYTLFDNADIYCHGICESVFGEAMKEVLGMRERILIATKCGIRFPGEPNSDSPPRYDFSAEHILRSCEQSLKRMKIETIDLYQLHRPDVLMNPEEVAGAFETLRKQGKAREFGVSNFLPSFVETLQEFCPMPLAVNQVEIHLGRLDCFDDGTLDQCIRRNITPMAWSPLGGGWLGSGGKVDPKDPRASVKTKLLETLDQTATKYGVSRTIISLAWLLKHPGKIVPIVGSINPERIREAVKADAIDLSREDWYRIYTAARGKPLP